MRSIDSNGLLLIQIIKSPFLSSAKWIPCAIFLCDFFEVTSRFIALDFACLAIVFHLVSIAINVNASRTSSSNENIFIRLVVGSEWKCVYFVRFGCFVFVLVTIFKMDDVWHLYFSHIFSRNSLSRWNVWAIRFKVDFLSFKIFHGLLMIII